jgi:hypothetical protein
LAESPLEIENLIKLEIPGDRNRYKTLLEEIGGLKKPSMLNCNKNIKILPEENQEFNSLNFLPLCKNKIISSSNEIYSLSNFDSPLLCNNGFETLPFECKNLPKQETLKLPLNKLKFKPKEIKTRVNLECLCCTENLLENIPAKRRNFFM